MEAIKEQGRGSVGGSRISLASGLVVAQVALSLVLVVAAGLFMRTFSSLANVRLGFDRDRVLLVNINAQRTSIPPADRLPTWERLRQSVLAVPGVASAAVSFMTPVTGGVWNNRVDVSGGVEMPERHKMSNFNRRDAGMVHHVRHADSGGPTLQRG
jgi:putative ABC transport system permease protein